MKINRILIPLGVGAALAGCGSSSNTKKAASTQAPARTVHVTLSDFKVASSDSFAKPGKVTFEITNRSATKHELVVLRTGKPAADLTHQSGARASESGHVGEVGDVPPGRTERLALRLPPGHYSLICNFPGHYMGGMHADLRVV